MNTRSLLLCGIISSLLYVIMNVFIPLRFEGYSYAMHTVSELSAIGAPTRLVWVLWAALYVTLFTLFGVGVLKSANGNKHLRSVGWIMLVYGVVNVYWPPMHLRGNTPTLTDTLHIVWASVTVLMMMLMMGFGAAAFGREFRLYTIVTMAVHIIFGILTSLQAPNIPKNGPTPTIGIWERINIAAFMLWIIVLAFILLRDSRSSREIRPVAA